MVPSPSRLPSRTCLFDTRTWYLFRHSLDMFLLNLDRVQFGVPLRPLRPPRTLLLSVIAHPPKNTYSNRCDRPSVRNIIMRVGQRPTYESILSLSATAQMMIARRSCRPSRSLSRPYIFWLACDESAPTQSCDQNFSGNAFAAAPARTQCCLR